jgi:hypothetical protein
MIIGPTFWWWEGIHGLSVDHFEHLAVTVDLHFFFFVFFLADWFSVIGVIPCIKKPTPYWSANSVACIFLHLFLYPNAINPLILHTAIAKSQALKSNVLQWQGTLRKGCGTTAGCFGAKGSLQSVLCKATENILQEKWEKRMMNIGRSSDTSRLATELRRYHA